MPRQSFNVRKENTFFHIFATALPQQWRRTATVRQTLVYGRPAFHNKRDRALKNMKKIVKPLFNVTNHHVPFNFNIRIVRILYEKGSHFLIKRRVV